MAKRVNGEGSIFQLADGRWRAQVSRGGGRYATRTVATSELAAKALRALHGEEDATGTITRGDLRVSDLLDEWQRKDEAASSRTVGTRRSNGVHLAAWRDTIGGQRVSRLTIGAVEDAMVAMSAGRARPYSRETMAKRRSVLSQVFAAAIRRGHCSANPAARAVLPADAVRTAKRRAFTVAQAEAIIRETAPRRNGAAYLLGLSLGLRPGELFGLRWSAVDWRRGTLHIQRAVNMENGSPELRDSLKTQGSLRTLAMPAFVIDALRAHAERQDAEERPAEWIDNDLIFPNDIGGAVDLNVFRRWFTATVAALGFGDGWTPNQMRHTAATLLADHGSSLEDIADMLGHTTTRMVEQHYRNSHRPEQSAHVAAMEELLGPKPRRKRRAS